MKKEPVGSNLDTLIQAQGYRICRLLNLSEFVKFCTDRDVSVTAERLRKLELLRVFFPVLRIHRIDSIQKIELVNEGRGYHKLGTLLPGENWDGATRIELAQFDFSARVINSWREHGNAWDPAVEHTIHNATIESDARRHEAYYSQFQLIQLDDLVSRLNVRVETEWAVTNELTLSTTWGDTVKSELERRTLQNVKYLAKENRREQTSVISQFISNRYYPKTQTDQRHMMLSTGGFSLWEDWDWHEYARTWNAPAAAVSLKLEKSELKKLYRWIRSKEMLDPLEDWANLVQFVAPQKRALLKGAALRHLLYREMATMIELFHKDAFDESLSETRSERRFRIPDVSPSENPMLALEQVANDFKVNPKPRVVLFVEGETELKLVPLVFAALFPARPCVYGIELVNLRGIGNATGPKDESRSALWRLIDYLHHHQTIAFVLLDNEGTAAFSLGVGLKLAKSIHFPDRRVTRKNYIKLWKHSLELDNFNDSELAIALTEYSGGTISFTKVEVSKCRTSVNGRAKNRTAYTLERLYKDRSGGPLKKPEFVDCLMRIMMDPKANRKPENRPIARFLKRVAVAAELNHQPVSQSIWEYNQLTGHVGTLRAGAVARRKTASGEPRKRRRK